MLEGEQPLPEQLQRVFEIWTVRPFTLAARSPAAEELMAAPFEFVNDLFDGARQHLIQRLGRRLRRAQRPRPEALARILVAAALGFKLMATSPRQLQKLVDDLVNVSLQP